MASLDRAWVREKKCCVWQWKDAGVGPPGPAAQKLDELCVTSRSVSWPPFPYLYDSCPISPENSEERRKEEKENAEGDRNFLICETRKVCRADWSPQLIGWL